MAAHGSDGRCPPPPTGRTPSPPGHDTGKVLAHVGPCLLPAGSRSPSLSSYRLPEQVQTSAGRESAWAERPLTTCGSLLEREGTEPPGTKVHGPHKLRLSQSHQSLPAPVLEQKPLWSRGEAGKHVEVGFDPARLSGGAPPPPGGTAGLSAPPAPALSALCPPGRQSASEGRPPGFPGGVPARSCPSAARSPRSAQDAGLRNNGLPRADRGPSRQRGALCQGLRSITAMAGCPLAPPPGSAAARPGEPPPPQRWARSGPEAASPQGPPRVSPHGGRTSSGSPSAVRQRHLLGAPHSHEPPPRLAL
ncbi:basic salivary proline-rich protein 2-like [Antechinus flavipes]|uniref:basic salivary proline-rich protein 2-like n=1 Tax=Antechinus flavipes TaxID=38775 RepID=UPI00223626B5|nr:basic salivary proline-rich protein 2-like [Antechinus flavipes]